MNRIRALGGCCLLCVAGLAALGAATVPVAADVGRWSPIGPYGGPVQALAVDPVHAGVIYAVAGYSIFKSVDGGATWSAISHGESAYTPVSTCATSR